MTNQRKLNPKNKGVRNRQDQPISEETEELVRKYKKSSAYKKFQQRFKRRHSEK